MFLALQTWSMEPLEAESPPSGVRQWAHTNGRSSILFILDLNLRLQKNRGQQQFQVADACHTAVEFPSVTSYGSTISSQYTPSHHCAERFGARDDTLVIGYIARRLQHDIRLWMVAHRKVELGTVLWCYISARHYYSSLLTWPFFNMYYSCAYKYTSVGVPLAISKTV